MKEKTLNKLKADYEEFKMKPSLDLWSELDEKLDDMSRITRKGHFEWWKYAVATILLMISTGMFMYFNQNNSVGKKNNSGIVKSTIKVNKNSVQIIKGENINSNSEVSDNEIDLVFSEKNKVKEFNSRNKEFLNIKIIKTKNNDFFVENHPQIIFNEIPLNNLDLTKAEDKIVFNEEMPKKNTSKYIQANDLLTGREFEKARKENLDKQFGVIDIDRIKGPNSLKILGITIYSDSLEK